jgi:hypothetical protein
MSKTNDILPEGYETPSSGGNYMKLEIGDNELRAMSKPIMGWIYWDMNGKPVRINAGPKAKPTVDPALIKVDKQGKKDLKFFWAFVVFNIKTGTIQIIELTQSSIQKGIEEYLRSPKWGSYFGYDINLKKIMTGDKTSYQVLTNPPSPITDAAKKAFTERGKINLAAMFVSGDPFAAAPVAALAPPPVQAPAAEVVGDDDLPF